MFLVIPGGGVWVQVAHAGPTEAGPVETAAVQVVDLLVSA